MINDINGYAFYELLWNACIQKIKNKEIELYGPDRDSYSIKDDAERKSKQKELYNFETKIRKERDEAWHTYLRSLLTDQQKNIIDKFKTVDNLP